MSMTFKNTAAALTLFAAITAGQTASADSTSRVSEGSSTAIGNIVKGSGAVIKGGAELLVVSTFAVSKGVGIVLREVSTGALVPLKIVGQGVDVSATWIGKTLKPIVTQSGTMLTESGEVLVLIPGAAVAGLFYGVAYGVDGALYRAKP